MIQYNSNGLQEFYKDDRFKDCLGQGQVAVVMDSGIDLDHPAFGEDRDNDKVSDRILKGKDFTRDKDNTVQDRRGHGSQVAGVIASIATSCKILPIQITSNKGSSNTLDFEDALKWLLSVRQQYPDITVVNVSLSDAMNHQVDFVNTGTTDENIEFIPVKLFTDLFNAGITICASAGNYYKWYAEKGETEGVGIYAALYYNLGVMATNSNGLVQSTNLGDFSQRRDDAIAAPGNKIKLIRLNKPDKTTMGRGTSYASPFLAGCVILLQSVAKKYVNKYLTPNELETIIFDTATHIGEYQEINVYAAAQKILELV